MEKRAASPALLICEPLLKRPVDGSHYCLHAVGSSSGCPGSWASSAWAAYGVQAVLCLPPVPRREFPSPGPSYSCSCHALAVGALQTGRTGSGHAPAVDTPGEQMGPTDEEVLIVLLQVVSFVAAPETPPPQCHSSS